MVEKLNIFFNFFLNFKIFDIKVGIFIGYGFFGKWMFEGKLFVSLILIYINGLGE